jgi:hypothetical protein
VKSSRLCVHVTKCFTLPSLTMTCMYVAPIMLMIKRRAPTILTGVWRRIAPNTLRILRGNLASKLSFGLIGSCASSICRSEKQNFIPHGGTEIPHSPDVPQHDCIGLAPVIQQDLGHVLRHRKLLDKHIFVKLSKCGKRSKEQATAPAKRSHEPSERLKIYRAPDSLGIVGQGIVRLFMNHVCELVAASHQEHEGEEQR